ncbi:MAG: hypothetical protein KJN64_03670 [Ignavibacteria bacterium]|nr:hypothetical protein [Ignavibacteria bacterium]MBT8390285.1 hypothetical protein [Ignavibacteria bacterium]NNJ53217.1 hypothetical protein [Ignavibacteriaceae bacterium]NNL22326.1 hypothetical protein [Ignavibacteriaceae bacterium]
MKYFFFFIFLAILGTDLFAQKEFDWETYFEKSGSLSTADYEQTMIYFQNLAEYSEFAEFHSFGVSGQMREIKYLLVTKEKNEDRQMSSISWVRELFKPVVLIINGIHSGEIEGKDASMILMREILITKEKEYLLDSLNMIVVPIFNIDGHERKSKYNRINQNGPEEMGWRTTAQNLNLNRDWMKADTPEMQWMLKLITSFNPDFAIDTHATDGADYQYTITYSVEWSKNIYHSTGEWLEKIFIPYLEKGVEEKGFLVHPYVFLKNWRKGLDDGLIYWPATPRFSTGYFALRNKPSLLIETHMIKPYKERVFATKAMIETTLDIIYSNASGLINLNKEADEQSINIFCKKDSYFPLSYDRSENYELINFKGYEYYWKPSDISGKEKLVYTSKKKDFSAKYYNDVIVTDSVKVPHGYFIPLEWQFLAEKMKSEHNVEFKVQNSKPNNRAQVIVEKYKFFNVKFDEFSYEGRQRVNFDLEVIQDEINLEQEMIYIPTDQKSVRVIVNLLEPQSGDSYVRWGFMNQIFEQKEYYEDYVMEKVAVEMLTKDPELKKEFETKLKIDEAFRNDPRARLDFFYERSPYYDEQKNVYPILRVVE